MKIAVIADPHIGTQKDNFVPNWEAVVAHVNSLDVAFSIILGDLTLDGANLDDDLIFARSALTALRQPVLVLPGNHDVGDVSRESRQPVDTKRLARWKHHFGSDRWICDAIPGWRLVGVNSQIFGTGLAEEEEQWEAIGSALDPSSKRTTVLFTHMPLFLENWDEADRPYWAVLGHDRKRLRTLLEMSKTVAVVSAHVHRTLDLQHASEPRLIWAAASSFLSRDESMPPQPGKELLGVTILDFTGDDIEVRFDKVPGIVKTYIEDYNGSIYPAPV
jgi:3',5'-cyclic AMP phosphodiesterase CpdA